MTENNAAQPGLTDDEIRVEIHNAIGFAFDPGETQEVNAADLMNVARALLSKLRAEGVQASDEREEFKAWFDEHTIQARMNGVHVNDGLAFSAWQERARRAALASAPVADDVQAMLKDPAIVHTNMCRGIIAPITFDMLAHVLGDEATAAWLDSRRVSAPVADERECGNADCGWRGATERMCGSVGPLCPECGEITEAIAPVAKPNRAPVDDGICWSSKEIQRRQKEEDDARAAYYHGRASAPVAGEAHPIGYCAVWGVRGSRMVIHRSRITDEQQARLAAKHWASLDSQGDMYVQAVYAAPQASEAVRNEALYLLREARALLPMFATAEAIGDWSEKVNRFAAGDVIDIPPQADKDGAR